MAEFLSIKELDMIDVYLDINSLNRLNLHINKKNPHITPVKIFSINKKYLGSLDVSKDGKIELHIIHIENIFDSSDSHPIDIYEGSNFIFVEDRGTNNFMITFHIL